MHPCGWGCVFLLGTGFARPVPACCRGEEGGVWHGTPLWCWSAGGGAYWPLANYRRPSLDPSPSAGGGAQRPLNPLMPPPLPPPGLSSPPNTPSLSGPLLFTPPFQTPHEPRAPPAHTDSCRAMSAFRLSSCCFDN